jgi:hypothetical protein
MWGDKGQWKPDAWLNALIIAKNTAVADIPIGDCRPTLNW